MRSAASNVAKRAGGRFMNTPPTFSGGVVVRLSVERFRHDIIVWIRSRCDAVRGPTARGELRVRVPRRLDERERLSSSSAGSENRGVVFMGPNDVQVKDIPFPKLELDSTNSPVVSNGKSCCNTGQF